MNDNHAPFDAKARIRVRVAFLVVVALAVAMEVVIDPMSVNPDGVSYLDLGDAILDGRPWAIVGYFSPLYAVWVAAAVRIVQPSIANEFLVVHAASGAIALLAAVAFEALITQVVEFVRGAKPQVPVREGWWRMFGYGLFLWSLIRNVGPAQVTPDVAVMAVVFAATALVLRMTANGAPRPRTAATLGLVLGVGYLAKAVVFVNGFMVLGIFTWLARKAPRAVFVAWATFLVVTAPWITAISLNKGRPTFGDVGRLALVWFQSPVPVLHWQGDEPGSGTPVHPTRRIMRNPDVFEFATPFPVSYPPWYDASYWSEGVRWHPDARVIIARAAQSLKGTAPHLWMAVAVLVALLVWGRSAGPLTAIFGPAGALALPAIATYLVYSPIATFPRYLAGWSVLLYLFIVLAWATWKNGRMLRAAETVMVALLIWFAWQVTRVVSQQARASIDVASHQIRREDDGDTRAAETLRRAGLGTGDRVAAIGTVGAFTYWARLARLRMVVEAPAGYAGMFWRSDSTTRTAVLRIFRGQGARAVVADSLPATLDPGWQRIPESRYAYCLFDAASANVRCPAGP